ncbi:unnamed protein product [Candida verbasci]|uniref:Pre-mRNA-splicing factor CLF1 n=1 Tax=Candida verbasci TaxID=1227364 RepID=A0A9W4TY45_9ASCO|nr:unnamed protein product [Candida verbasci]
MSDQITSKDIFQDAFTRQESQKLSRPKQTIQDLEELKSYQQTKRKEYEQQLNKNRLNFGQWIRYARWEIEHNHDWNRGRSIFERALDVDIQYVPFWIQYLQMELSYKNINHARNLLDRATKTLPTINKLWFLYIQTEEMLKNYAMVRQLFEKWLEWHPDYIAWDAYINFESRYEENENVRLLYQRYIKEFGKLEIWNKWIDYELETNNEVENTRSIFESCIDLNVNKLTEDDVVFAAIVSKWANWEISQKEYGRAKQIYDILLNNHFVLPDNIKKLIYDSFVEFESNFGNQDSLESSVLANRKLKYEQELASDPFDYDSWWSLLNILMDNYSVEEIRSAFKKVTNNAPPDKTKTIRWRRYIMIWIRYAFYEEFDNHNIELSREIWNKCLKIIPHKRFSYSKIWKNYADFELRNSTNDELTKVRKIYGRSIGQTCIKKPKPSIFQNYINFEMKLGEYDRIRSVYEKWLEVALITQSPANDIITKYLNFEMEIGEYARCESILDLAFEFSSNEDTYTCFNQQDLFQTAVDFFKDEMKYDKIRDLYEQLIEQDPSTSNWISYALFESIIPTAAQLEEYLATNDEEFEIDVGEEQIENTRSIFKRAEEYYKDVKDDDNRLVILEVWNDYEEVNGTEESLKEIQSKFPKRVTKHRRNTQGIEEEYIEYLFPDKEEDQQKPQPNNISEFLLNAKKWAESRNN